jgi:hypothetical protein
MADKPSSVAITTPSRDTKLMPVFGAAALVPAFALVVVAEQTAPSNW